MCSDYKSLGRDPELLDSYVVFLDVLGSKVLAEGTPKQVESRFQRFRAAWNRAMKLSGVGGPIVAASTFTDNVVVGAPLVDLDPEDALGEVIEVAASFQLLLAEAGFLCRGGLTRGTIWIDDEFVFGPGLVKAAQLEASGAYYPRTLIDPGVRNEIALYLQQYNRKIESSLGFNIAVDRGGGHFINYLVAGMPDMPRATERELLKTHRQAVISALFDTRFIPKDHDKVLWSARYHNYIVTTRYGADTTLLIEATDPSTDFMELHEV